MRNKFIRAGIVALLLAISLGVGVKVMFSSHRANAGNRQALIRIHDHLTVGQSIEDVRVAFGRYKTDELKFHEDEKEVVITMPLEFGAKDWLLRVEIENGSITEVLMRTTDGPKPLGSPDDKK